MKITVRCRTEGCMSSQSSGLIICGHGMELISALFCGLDHSSHRKHVRIDSVRVRAALSQASVQFVFCYLLRRRRDHSSRFDSTCCASIETWRPMLLQYDGFQDA